MLPHRHQHQLLRCAHQCRGLGCRSMIESARSSLTRLPLSQDPFTSFFQQFQPANATHRPPARACNSPSSSRREDDDSQLARRLQVRFADEAINSSLRFPPPTLPAPTAPVNTSVQSLFLPLSHLLPGGLNGSRTRTCRQMR